MVNIFFIHCQHSNSDQRNILRGEGPSDPPVEVSLSHPHRSEALYPWPSQQYTFTQDFTLSTLSTSFETGSLSESRAHQLEETDYTTSPSNPPVSASLTLGLQNMYYFCECLLDYFVHRCWELNSVPCACKARASLLQLPDTQKCLPIYLGV